MTSNGGSLAVSAGDSGPQSGLVWSLRFGLELAAAGHVKRPILPPIYLEMYSSLASAINRHNILDNCSSRLKNDKKIISESLGCRLTVY
jgi:hypothetical protein